MQGHGRALVTGVALVLLGLAVSAVAVTREVQPSSTQAAPALTVAGALGGGKDDAEGFARAFTPRPFVFPDDHGPHPDFRTEWWYWTGNLQAEDGREFGYQLTLFRSALTPQAPGRASAWGTRQVYLGHFTVTDVKARRFHPAERFSRQALGLAGAQASPFRVWLEDWEVRGADDGTFPMQLRASAGEVALALTLEQGKPAVPQGRDGLSQKGPQPGNASHYYSLTRMPSRGTVTVGGQAHAVTGTSWMDREWSTSALGPEQVGWDWFSLKLSDSTELMYYQLRRKDGSADPFSAGSWVGASGEPARLAREDVRLQVLDTWRSPGSGATYPARWRLEVPSRALELTVTPLVADQELPVSFRYWEGAVRLEGTREGQPVSGRGYVELTGYADAPERTR